MSRNSNFIPKPIEKNMRLLKLPDCVYLSEYCKCSILKVDDCLGESCPFYRNSSQRRILQVQCYRHLNSLSIEEQSRISGKYYSGKMLWTEQYGKD